jgi:nucleoid DNA-binding protein
MSIEVNKRLFWRYVNIKLNRAIHSYHVFSILSILLEEIIEDLKKSKEIKIINFATISLNDTKPKKYFDVRYQKIMESKGGRLIKIDLSKKIKKKLIQYLDVDGK